MKRSKRIKKSNSWKIKQHRDQFLKNPKLSVSVLEHHKLIELNKKYKFIKSNTNLLDLGSFPGGWSQIAVKIITTGKIMAVDIKEMDPLKNVKFLKGDIIENETKSKIIKYFDNNLDVIISDMAANTTGNKSLELNKNKSIMH